MKIKAVLLAMCAGVLLTGCGDDAVLKKIRSEKAAFVDSVYKVDVDDIETKQYKDLVVNEEMLPFVKSVNDIILEEEKRFGQDEESEMKKDRKRAKKRWEKMSEEDRDYYRDFEEYFEEAYGYGEYEEDVYPEVDFSSVNSVKNNFSVDGEFLGAVNDLKKEEMAEVLKRFEEVGITDLVSALDELEKRVREDTVYGTQSMSRVRKGVHFALYAEYDGEPGESEKKVKPRFTLDVHVPYHLIVMPGEYQDFLKNQISEGFYVKDANTGGYMDRLVLVSSWNDGEVPYEKCVSLYFSEGKLLQAEIKAQIIDAFQVKKSDVFPLFTESERETMVRILSDLSGDDAAADDFVANFSPEREGSKKSGEFGSCRWNCEKNGSGYYTITVQGKE